MSASMERISIGLLKCNIFVRGASSPCNGNHFLVINCIILIKKISLIKVDLNKIYMYVCMYIIYLLCMIKVGLGGVLEVCGECYNNG